MKQTRSVSSNLRRCRQTDKLNKTEREQQGVEGRARGTGPGPQGGRSLAGDRPVGKSDALTEGM